MPDYLNARLFPILQFGLFCVCVRRIGRFTSLCHFSFLQYSSHLNTAHSWSIIRYEKTQAYFLSCIGENKLEYLTYLKSKRHDDLTIISCNFILNNLINKFGFWFYLFFVCWYCNFNFTVAANNQLLNAFNTCKRFVW